MASNILLLLNLLLSPKFNCILKVKRFTTNHETLDLTNFLLLGHTPHENRFSRLVTIHDELHDSLSFTVTYSDPNVQSLPAFKFSAKQRCAVNLMIAAKNTDNYKRYSYQYSRSDAFLNPAYFSSIYVALNSPIIMQQMPADFKMPGNFYLITAKTVPSKGYVFTLWYFCAYCHHRFLEVSTDPKSFTLWNLKQFWSSKISFLLRTQNQGQDYITANLTCSSSLFKGGLFACLAVERYTESLLRSLNNSLVDSRDTWRSKKYGLIAIQINRGLIPLWEVNKFSNTRTISCDLTYCNLESREEIASFSVWVSPFYLNAWCGILICIAFSAIFVTSLFKGVTLAGISEGCWGILIL
ncbi:hypothetical protein Fcan01_10367 [Folsomia candida]|uniref:Uncharacterized protein n=1 Tax=Folsomia candida TaxID=158441 RepID=A0A226EAG7_FOLCA|nr:hypothetical protein Fcan01_10367 [Folsomia candida]